MRVSVQELKAAATTIDGLADEVGKVSLSDDTAGAYMLMGELRAGPATAAALPSVEPAERQAVSVAVGRYQEIAAIMRTSASWYLDTDVQIAARFDAIEDLNSGVMPQ
ncbi:type VII secretion target [Nocardia yunnanensis]|uniref:type VII secretion target n=1 Tax=Nocardia yunnanensis TaxID=2382165 RepID=UPI0013C46125|nr:type VII secretion target [Nocardia yunnanensis]